MLPVIEDRRPNDINGQHPILKRRHKLRNNEFLLYDRRQWEGVVAWAEDEVCESAVAQEGLCSAVDLAMVIWRLGRGKEVEKRGKGKVGKEGWGRGKKK